MFNLMKSEVLRFRNLALTVGLLHVAVLAYLHTFGELINSDSVMTNVGALAYTLLGVAFGVMQMGPYRKPNQWAFLIHRPLSTTRIWLALTLAAVLLLAVVSLLPMLIVFTGIDASAAQYVDIRFYLMAPYIFGLALAGYFIACFILLASSRIAVVVIALPSLFMTNEAGLGIFIPQVLAIALLTYLCWRAFRADLHAKPEHARDLVPAALAIEWGLFYAIFSACTLLYQFGQMLANEHPLYNPEPDTYFMLQSLEDHEVVNYGLGPASDDTEAMLRQEVGIADIHTLHANWNRFPFRHQLYFADRDVVLQDREKGLRWPFSHDQMLFKGWNARSGGDAGWMGLSGKAYESLTDVPQQERFKRVPHVMPQVDNAGMVILPQQLYVADFDQQRTMLRHALPEGEWYQSPIQIEGNVAAVVTNRNLHLFAPHDVLEKEHLLQAEAVIPLPDENDNLLWINATELVDGYLLTFVYGNRQMDGWGDASIHSIYQPFGGEHRLLNVRELAPSFSELFHYRRYLVSPLFAYLTTATWSLIQPYDEESVSLRELVFRPLPSDVITFMLLVSLLSAGVTFLLAVRAGISRTRSIAWTIANALTGLPGLVCFLFLADWRAARTQHVPETVTA